MASIDDFFTPDAQGRLVFTGDRLVCYIPERYQNLQVFSIIDDFVESLGIFEMVVMKDDGTILAEGGLFLTALLRLSPSRVGKANRNGKSSFELTFEKNDIFLISTTFIMNNSLAYTLFAEFLSLGHMPEFVSYDESATFFQRLSSGTGLKFQTNHTIYELLLAYLARKADDLNTQYRHDPKGKLTFISLQSVSHGTDSTTAKIAGSYFQDGLLSAIVTEKGSENLSELEQLLMA